MNTTLLDYLAVKVTIETDHKPLEAIFKIPLHRIQIEILAYNPTIRNKKGTRCSSCLQSTSGDSDISAAHAIHTISEQSALCWFILQGWSDTIQQVPDNLRKYWTFHDELAVYEDIIFKGKRTLIPPSWKLLILPQLHCSDKGVHSTLAIPCDHIFSPGMKQDIISFVQKSRRFPLRGYGMYIASDLIHYKGKNFLLFEDSYLGYFDFHVLTSSTSDEVIKTLKSWFAQHGIPNELHTDGGLQYASLQFLKFREVWNFQHRISSPHFPWSNGLMEQYVQEAKNLLEK
ncbi:hypothetical protein PR048_005980 [Dryococelus australis]|uniref:Integrase catalytic domain-containing protein n=1 Tax=Dryococelus australis TaxID=614101 RepID=A0ABQ9I9R6_9NEOP|nr:hypothetical protein PR048_005980 [Dryococelus australis]